MGKLNFRRPGFRHPTKAYEAIDGSDIPSEFWGGKKFRTYKSKAKLRREADEAMEQIRLRTIGSPTLRGVERCEAPRRLRRQRARARQSFEHRGREEVWK